MNAHSEQGEQALQKRACSTHYSQIVLVVCLIVLGTWVLLALIDYCAKKNLNFFCYETWFGIIPQRGDERRK